MPLKKRAVIFCVVAVCLATFCTLFGCAPDLGNITDDEDYAKKFSSVKFIRKDLTVSEKSVLDLYNENAADFNSKDFKCPTDVDEYRYMAVFAGESVSIDEFAIFLRADEDVTFNVYVYKANALPSVIAMGEESDFETYTDEETHEEKKKLKTFDEPERSDAIASSKVTLKANEWVSMYVRSFDTGGSSAVRLEKDECLLFQFDNNCFAYDSDGNAAEKEYSPANVCFTSMLIRVA